MTGDCQECDEAEALSRLLAVQEVLHAVIWRELAPLSGLAAAAHSLAAADALFRSAGFEDE